MAFVRHRAAGPILAFFSLLALGEPTGAQSTAPVRFHGGPADGMIKGRVVSRDRDMELVEVGLSSPGASPVSAANQPAIASLLTAYRTRTPLPASAVAADATSLFCARGVDENCTTGRFESFPFGTGYSSNTPYQLDDGRVRIEWSREGSLRFVSFLTMSDGRVLNIATLPPVMPVAVAPTAGAPSNG